MFNDYKVGVIGLGYVELPFSIAIEEKYKDVGYNINAERGSEVYNYFDKSK